MNGIDFSDPNVIIVLYFLFGVLVGWILTIIGTKRGKIR